MLTDLSGRLRIDRKVVLDSLCLVGRYRVERVGAKEFVEVVVVSLRLIHVGIHTH